MKQREPTYSDDPIYGASSSSTSPHIGDYEGATKKPKGDDYEVFLSFRGVDTRKGFADYLYNSLVNARIRVFRDDDELHVGEEIGSKLLCSIMQSKISIPIISKDYASSKWCLRELVQILKCRRSRGQLVLPIFYKVEPSQVKNLKEGFGEAIKAHKENLDEMVVKEWEEALKEVSSLKGWESEKIKDGREGALVNLVVEKIVSELKRPLPLIVPKELVGIDDFIKQIKSSIDDKFNGTRIIGICGVGGVGKTTVARVLYDNLSSHFKHLSFVENIRETSLRMGIEQPQKQLIRDILGSSYEVSNIDEGINVIKSQFTSKKTLILLDDLDDEAHLNALAGDRNWFEAGSIVIITTRNESILAEVRATHTYKLNELPLDPSLILFSRHAFQQDSPHSDYEVISHDIVSTIGGLPLTLEVTGSFLHGKNYKIWEDSLEKLKEVHKKVQDTEVYHKKVQDTEVYHKKVQDTEVYNKKVQDFLRISYESLDYEMKQIFLDIACFCIGLSKQSVTYMWDACGFSPENRIEVLSFMYLIKIDKDDNIRMHDQLRDLGREIVRLEHPKEPQERSRLWIRKEALDVLDNNKGTNKIEALCLRFSEIEDPFLDNYDCGKSYRGEQFNELTDLRFLQVSNVNFIGDFQNLLPKLRWLQWNGCPSYFKMVNFHPKKLAVLNLSQSAISEDWGGWDPLKMATDLKVLDLSHCKNLRRTPDLSAFESLEILNLEKCSNLEEIHPSIWYIKTLVSLDIHDCSKLEKLPTRVERMEESREFLCYDKLAQLSKSIGSSKSLTKLNLSHIKIKELPESIGSMKALKTLNASGCKLLDCISNSIGNLASLRLLDLSSCELLKEIPDSIGKLASLIELNFSWTSIKKLPESIGNLENLGSLYIDGAPVTELPSTIEMLTKLRVLSARYCKNLERLPSSIGKLVSLNELHLDDSGIRGLPKSISELSSLEHLSAWDCKNLQEIPEPPWSLTALYVDFPTPSLPYLSKLISLQELSLLDLRPLECLSELPVQLSKLSIKCGFLPDAELRDLEKRLYELIRYKSSGQREVTGSKREHPHFITYQIDEAANPTIAKSSEEVDPFSLSLRGSL